MARKEKQFHYLYKITNTKNGKYYIGMHSTHNLNDGYMGGGKRIRNSIRKHGLSVHTKEILEYFENRELLRQKEIEIVNENLLKDPMCMNLVPGGTGGNNWRYLTEEMLKEFSQRGKLKMQHLRENDPLWVESLSKKLSESAKKRTLRGDADNFIYSFSKKSHSDETKKIIGEKNAISQKGEKNSQYGKCWVYNDSEMINIKIHKDQIDNYIEKGWGLGLKMEYFKK